MLDRLDICDAFINKINTLSLIPQSYLESVKYTILKKTKVCNEGTFIFGRSSSILGINYKACRKLAVFNLPEEVEISRKRGIFYSSVNNCIRTFVCWAQNL